VKAAAGNEDEDDEENKATEKTQNPSSVVRKTEAAFIRNLREKISKLKKKDGQSGFKLTFVATPFEIKAENGDLSLKDQTITFSAGQAFWTVGDDLDNDVILPKAGITWGA